MTSNIQAEWNVWSQFVVRNSRGTTPFNQDNIDVIPG